MVKRPRQVASDAALKPSFNVFLALVSLAAHFERRWIIVSQRKLLERVRGTTGRAMSRRSLNRHLAGLERDHVVNRLRRHQRKRTGELELRPTLYTFGAMGALWIRRLRGAATIPLGRLAVPKTAPSRNPLLSEKRLTVDKSLTARRRREANRRPRKRGQETAPGSAPRRRR
jgi:hypothetical protein